MSATRVVVGVSGGVDSSVAALLLREQGFDVHGVFMKNWEDDFEAGYCPAEQDLNDAEDVCASLDIPLHKVDFVAEYRERVFEYFLAEHRRGRTPNPDVLCNKEIKFRAFLDHALDLGAEYIATGHYARTDIHSGGRRLLKGVDPGKDQSYFLYVLDQNQLARTLFPLGELQKSDVRGIAERHGLVTYDKKDSTGICFIGERDFGVFLSRFIPASPGPMQTPQGETVGEHQGLMFYTLGQRKGLAVGGRAGGSGEPWYVVGKDVGRNVLLVSQGEHPMLYGRRLWASRLHWIGTPTNISIPYRCFAKTRYRQADQACTLSALDGDRCEVRFERAQRALTPGQSVVFYAPDGEQCLGGAVIDTAFVV